MPLPRSQARKSTVSMPGAWERTGRLRILPHTCQMNGSAKRPCSSPLRGIGSRRAFRAVYGHWPCCMPLRRDPFGATLRFPRYPALGRRSRLCEQVYWAG